MPRYVQLEINEIREIAKRPVSSELNTREGTLRNTILRFMNDADQTLQGRLIVDVPNLTFWDASTEIPLVSGQRDYDLASDIFGPGIIQLVEYSQTGSALDYVPIFSVHRSNMVAGQGGYQFDYDTSAGKLRVSPVPEGANGKFRVTYVRAVDALDVRRGRINAVADDGTSYTTITLENDTWLDSAGFTDQDYICVVSASGAMIRRNMQFINFNSSTRVITLSAGQLISAGAISAGQYVVVGRNTRDQSELPANCDRYRIHYAALAIQMQTSNTDAVMQDPKLQSIYDDIELAFRRSVPSRNKIPLQNPAFI